MNKYDNNTLLNREHSLILCGGGISLMLFHHLFYGQSSRFLYDDIMIGERGLINELAILSKLCVSIFVFKSGYGLTVNWDRKTPKTKQFFCHRFKSLYFNYWFIWLLFVPIGVIVFNRSFTDVYGSYWFVKFLLDLLGLLNCLGMLGYNPTWWFYSCIIILYALFPFLQKVYMQKALFVVTIGILASQIFMFAPLAPVSGFMLPFLAGMYIARQSTSKFENITKSELTLCILLLCIAHNFSGELKTIINTLLCVSLALLVAKIRLPKVANNIVMSLGKHSTNIFLFHTFIFYYWFRDFIYMSRNPLLIFLQLLVICYIISVMIEWLKSRIGFYKLCK